MEDSSDGYRIKWVIKETIGIGVYMSGTSKNMTIDGRSVVMCPMFEIATNPTIDLREMEEYRMKKNGILVVYGEVEV